MVFNTAWYEPFNTAWYELFNTAWYEPFNTAWCELFNTTWYDRGYHLACVFCKPILQIFYKVYAPKRRFSMAEHTKMKWWFSKTFSRVWVLDLAYDPLTSHSKILISSFVPPSKTFMTFPNLRLEGKVHAPHAKNDLGDTRFKIIRKDVPNGLFDVPKSSFGRVELPKHFNHRYYRLRTIGG